MLSLHIEKRMHNTEGAFLWRRQVNKIIENIFRHRKIKLVLNDWTKKIVIPTLNRDEA